jgi:hypothetical protein
MRAGGVAAVTGFGDHRFGIDSVAGATLNAAEVHITAFNTWKKMADDYIVPLASGVADIFDGSPRYRFYRGTWRDRDVSASM